MIVDFCHTQWQKSVELQLTNRAFLFMKMLLDMSSEWHICADYSVLMIE